MKHKICNQKYQGLYLNGKRYTVFIKFEKASNEYLVSFGGKFISVVLESHDEILWKIVLQNISDILQNKY